MKNKLKTLLPESFSGETVNEIETLVESTVNERVEKVEKQLAGRLNSFLGEHIEKLKEVAMKELEADNELVRHAKLFESVKQLVRDEMVDEDTQAVIEGKDQEIAELKEAVLELKDYIDNLETQNEALTESLESVQVIDSHEDEDEELRGQAIVVSESEGSDVSDDEDDDVEEDEEVKAILEGIKYL